MDGWMDGWIVGGSYFPVGSSSLFVAKPVAAAALNQYVNARVFVCVCV